MSEESVVLVDEENRVLGTMPKTLAHGKITPLHRGFSCFVFRADDRRLLIQQRSEKKRTWPLAWSNSCCGHPTLTESPVDAARRRLKYELGLEASFLTVAANYRYCFTKDEVMENEICPVVVGIVRNEPLARPEEVAATTWMAWETFVEETRQNPRRFSEWCIEEAALIAHTKIGQHLIGM